jgi:secondary thiamine-phosphate synthase enzyme
MHKVCALSTHGSGLYEITDSVTDFVHECGISEGVCVVFIRHTSASVIIHENADPTAKRDLEAWMNRLVRPNDPLFTHTAEGPDDMPAHIKSVLTLPSLSIPIIEGTLALGTWQGIFLWEHRSAAHRRSFIVQVIEG